jgi:hypothetical protein
MDITTTIQLVVIISLGMMGILWPWFEDAEDLPPLD